tara:strand:- start:1073 stop:1699 length:627 start_codon:yes stop_codon:yes gene_type:complete
MQLQMQSYPCSHGIYINADTYKDASDATNYCLLLNDINITKGSVVKILYGKQTHQHFNHMIALNQFSIDDYDLFLKIDDDDIYRLDYVKHVVQDFESNHWDFSATCSTHVIKNSQIDFLDKMFFLKSKDKLHGHVLDETMPGTYAFSKKAIKKIMDNGSAYQWDTNYEDPLWLKWMIEDSEIKCAYRDSKDYTYIIHADNYCKPRAVN